MWGLSPSFLLLWLLTMFRVKRTLYNRRALALHMWVFSPLQPPSLPLLLLLNWIPGLLIKTDAINGSHFFSFPVGFSHLLLPLSCFAPLLTPSSAFSLANLGHLWGTKLYLLLKTIPDYCALPSLHQVPLLWIPITPSACLTVAVSTL